MDEVLAYLQSAPVLIIVLVIVVAIIFSRVSGGASGEVRPEDKVPHYKRFDRREPEMGDRRKDKMSAEAKAKAQAEQRKIGRRSRD